MAYKLKQLRVLSGSLNLLPPGDKIGAEDALQLENFRVDQQGALRSRNGTSRIASPEGGGPVHTFGRRGEVFYFGCGTSLFRNGDDVNPAATGLSGNPFGIVSMNGFAWIMDQSVQGRDDGVTFGQWGITAPVTAPVAGLGSLSSSNVGIPTGSYQFFVTFVLNDLSESNPSPVSDALVNTGVTGQNVLLSNISVSTDPRVVSRNIYVQGGTLGQAYLVPNPAAGGQPSIPDNTTTSLDFGFTEEAVLLEGIALEFNHDSPPAALGVVGPYFGRLLAFNSVANPNRLWWTDPGLPEYWPGAALDTGNWVDVGDDDEAILGVSCKARLAIIYKERSTWRLIGDPDTGFLEIANSKMGIVGPRAFCNAGVLDYFDTDAGGQGGIYSTPDGVNVTRVSKKIDPIFLGLFSAGVPPIDFGRRGQAAMEYVAGLLLFSFPEPGVTYPGNSHTLVYDELSGNWATMRVDDGALPGGFTALYYAGSQLWGGGNGGSNGTVLRIDLGIGNASENYGDEDGLLAIQLVAQTRFEDCGYPDNQKVFLDVVIDCETNGNALVVTYLPDNSQTGTSLGTITNTARGATTFEFGSNGAGIEAKNVSLHLSCDAAGAPVVIHAVYLYYYVEARLADSVSVIPWQPAGGRVAQVKELQLDIDSSLGPVNTFFQTDLPGNALAVREEIQVWVGGRRPVQLPFNVNGPNSFFEGRLFQFSAAAVSGPFRLYGARALIRMIGTYVEGYEAAGGFVWDSMEDNFESGLTHIPRGYAIALAANPIKRVREIELQIEAAGNVLVALLSDLPSETMAVVWRATVAATTGRRVARIPLPAGLRLPIEGRLFRLQLSGVSQFKLYEASIEILPVGVYLEAYETAAGAVWDSREIDFGVPKVKEAREIEVDIETQSGAVNLTLLSDLPSGNMAAVWGPTSVVTSGRRIVALALPQVEGRLFRLLVSGSNSFALYGAKIYLRPFGQYLTGGEGTSGAFWDSTELDLGTQTVKQIRQVELEVWAYGVVTVTVYTDLPGNAMAVRATKTFGPTNGRTHVQIPLQQGAVPENYFFGRLVRVTVASPASVKLFGARIHTRAIGLYIEGYEATAGAVWDSTPIDLGSPMDKAWDEVRFWMDSDGAVGLKVYTELPGEAETLQYTGALTNAAMSRGWATVPLPAGIEGRSVRLIASGAYGFRIYKAQVRARAIGRYIAGQGAGLVDGFRTLDFDYGTERVKLFKKLELDLETDGTMTLNVYTNQNGLVFTAPVSTGGVRATVKLFFPLNARGRFMRIEIVGPQPGRIYHLRAWMRPVNEPQGGWDWANYPLEDSAVLPEWSDLPVPETPPGFTWNDLPVEPTPPEWSWAPFPVTPTAAEWQWAKVLAVDGTSEKWEWIDIPGVAQEEVG